MTFLALDPFIESRVEAYEATRLESPQTDLRQFLPPPNHDKYLAVLLELVRVDLDLAWSRGEPRSVAHYRESFPVIFQHPDALQQIVFEEFRLRCEAGERPDPDQFSQQYHVRTDDWPVLNDRDFDTEPLSGDITLASDAQLGARNTENIPAPTVGTSWLGFQILELLGTGTFGTTFRATQTALAHREVVLKFSQLNHREAWRLARLQHTHIVPVLSVHEFGNHCAICMPYLGRRTLADVINAEPASEGAGQDRVTSALRLVQRLADALDHAHCRGILHGDVKPANVLITDDDQPLLFDFNLAEDANRPASSRIRGGTPAYMAPEQLLSWLGDPAEVDHRADIFSLGVVLYQLLTGRLPWLVPGSLDVREVLDGRSYPPTSATRINPMISPAVNAILTTCLAHSPADRYQSAAALSNDIRLQLDNLPLACARNTSGWELSKKWIRRHPRIVSATTAGVLGTLICAAMLAVWLVREARHRPVAAAQSLQEFTTAWDELRADFATASFDPEWCDDVNARAGRLIRQYVLEDGNHFIRSVRYLNARQQTEWRQNASSLAYMLGNAEYFGAQREPDSGRRLESLRSSLQKNQLASDLAASNPASEALQNQRQRILNAMSQIEGSASSELASISGTLPQHVLIPLNEAGSDQANVAGHVACDWYDLLFLGIQARDHHDLATAELRFRQATRVKPDDATNWLLLGDVLRKQHQYESAAAAFDVASALTMDDTAAIFQRGLCWLASRQLDRALADFSTVIERRPDLDGARLNRALAYMALDQNQLALDDLNAALADSCRETRAFFLRARVQQKLGNSLASQADLTEGLSRTPVDALSWIARGVARMHVDPQAALEDFQSALRLDPWASEARHNLAHVYAEILQQPQPAIEALDQCLRQDADDTLALAGRGVLRARLGKAKLALEDADRLLTLSLDAVTRYQAACICALCAADDRQLAARALSLLAESLRQDPTLTDLLADDPDLKTLHGSTEFGKLVTAISVVREQEAQGQPRQGESH